MTMAPGLVPYELWIDLDRYDRSLDLTPVERQVLADWNSRRGYHPLKISLARLCQPLEDVFSCQSALNSFQGTASNIFQLVSTVSVAGCGV